jgi:hypothetical protein
LKIVIFDKHAKDKIKCPLEIIIARVNITFSDQDASRHYHLISKQVSTATHTWKAQHSKIPLDKCKFLLVHSVVVPVTSSVVIHYESSALVYLIHACMLPQPELPKQTTGIH